MDMEKFVEEYLEESVFFEEDEPVSPEKPASPSDKNTNRAGSREPRSAGRS